MHIRGIFFIPFCMIFIGKTCLLINWVLSGKKVYAVPGAGNIDPIFSIQTIRELIFGTVYYIQHSWPAINFFAVQALKPFTSAG